MNSPGIFEFRTNKTPQTKKQKQKKKKVWFIKTKTIPCKK